MLQQRDSIVYISCGHHSMNTAAEPAAEVVENSSRLVGETADVDEEARVELGGVAAVGGN